MARLPRLVAPGHAHLVLQRGHNRQPVFSDDADRADYLAALEMVARAEAVGVHAWGLLEADVLLLVTPPGPRSLGRLMQGVNRRFVPEFNRRHGRSGTLWDGRFRCGVVEPGPLRLAALVLVDAGVGLASMSNVGAARGAGDAAHGAGGDKRAEPGRVARGALRSPSADGAAPTRPPPSATSAAHRLGMAPCPWIVDLPEYWSLGNTPFDREAAYARLLDQAPNPATTARLLAAAHGGWAVGSPVYCASVGIDLARPVVPRRPGRPSKTPA